VASQNDKPKQWHLKHPGGDQLKKDHVNENTGMPTEGKSGLAKVETGCSMYVPMPNEFQRITILNDSESNEEQEQELKQQPKDKQPEAEADEGKHDEDEDNKDQ